MGMATSLINSMSLETLSQNSNTKKLAALVGIKMSYYVSGLL